VTDTAETTDLTLIDDTKPIPRGQTTGYVSDVQLDMLERWIDQTIRVPVLGFNFGMDGVIGLVPGVGDLAATSVSAVFITDTVKLARANAQLEKCLAISLWISLSARCCLLVICSTSYSRQTSKPVPSA